MRYVVVKDRKSGEFLVVDSYNERVIDSYLFRSNAENLKDILNDGEDS